MMGIVCIMALAIFFQGIRVFCRSKRDGLLFGTSAGEAVIDFYYKYNLYGAEVIKKLREGFQRRFWLKILRGQLF